MAFNKNIYEATSVSNSVINLDVNSTWNGGKNLFMDKTAQKIPIGTENDLFLSAIEWVILSGANAGEGVGNYSPVINYYNNDFSSFPSRNINEYNLMAPANVGAVSGSTTKTMGFTGGEFTSAFGIPLTITAKDGDSDTNVSLKISTPSIAKNSDESAPITQYLRISNTWNNSLFENNCFQGVYIYSGIIGSPEEIKTALDDTLSWGNTYTTNSVKLYYDINGWGGVSGGEVTVIRAYSYALTDGANIGVGRLFGYAGAGHYSGTMHFMLPILIKKVTNTVTGKTPSIELSKVNNKYYINIKTPYSSIITHTADTGTEIIYTPQSQVRFKVDNGSWSSYANYTGSTTVDGVNYSTYSAEITAAQYYGTHTYRAQNKQFYYYGNENTRCYEFLYNVNNSGERTSVHTVRKVRWNLSSKSTSTTQTHLIEQPTNLTVQQNGLERTDSSYIDSMYIKWDHVDTRDEYGYSIYNGDTLVASGSTGNDNLTISNLSADINYSIAVWTKISTEVSASTTASKTLNKLPDPTNVSFDRLGINYGNLTWDTDYNDTSLTYFEAYDGDTSDGTTNNVTYTLQGLSQGQHTLGVVFKYNNPDNSNSSTFNSNKVTVDQNMTKLPTPVLASSEDYSNVVFRNSIDEDCYLLTDGSFVKVDDYVSGEIKQGITGITFSYAIAPDYDITGASYAFYSKLGSNAYAYDTDVATGTRSVGLGDTTYGSVGHHKVKVQAVYSADTDYNSDDSNEVEYPVNTLDAPTLVWGEVNHPSSRIIPDGYEPVEYIESDGRQYIDTGYAPAPLANIDIEFMYLGTEYDGWTCLYGVRGSANTSYFCAFINSDNDILSPNYSTYDPGNNSDTEIVPNGYMHIKTQRGQLYLNSQLQVNASTSLTNRTTPDANLYLLALGTPSGVDNRNIKARIYDCNIYDGDTIVRRYIPVRRTSDDKPGLYELLTDTFYPSNSGVDFIAGSDIILWDMNKVYESRIEWMPVTTVSASGDYADYYFVEVIGNDTVVGNAVTVLQPSDLTQRVGTWIPDPDPLNGAVKGLIAQLPSQTTDYVVNVRALSFNSWYVGGSAPGTASYQIIRLGVPQLPEWDPETFTISWSPVTDANTYYLYDSGVLIETITEGTSYHFLNLEDGLHQFRITAMKRTFAVN